MHRACIYLKVFLFSAHAVPFYLVKKKCFKRCLLFQKLRLVDQTVLTVKSHEILPCISIINKSSMLKAHIFDGYTLVSFT